MRTRGSYEYAIEDRIRENLPRIREWMLDLVAQIAARRLLDRRAIAADNKKESGPATQQRPGPGQT